jgi:hypothetical protein
MQAPAGSTFTAPQGPPAVALRAAAMLYGAGLLLHTADHFRRGTDAITREVLVLGTVGTIVGAIAVAAVLLGTRHAATLAVAVGAAKAIGVSTVHLLPQRSAYGDSFPGAGVDVWSWSAVGMEIAGAVALVAAGIAVLHRRRSSRASR